MSRNVVLSTAVGARVPVALKETARANWGAADVWKPFCDVAV